MNYIKEYPKVDAMKMIMAIAVIAIHTNPLVDVESEFIKVIYHFFISCAVPFFFLISGYFIGKKQKS